MSESFESPQPSLVGIELRQDANHRLCIELPIAFNDLAY